MKNIVCNACFVFKINLCTLQKTISFRCSYEGCQKSFTFPNKLKHHLKVHQG